mmetsp:Transcript_31905/g.63206  ORF Transcript_31905/g.63206 Transcript_31905/m.63206 type:complete len:207 (+) Transcript_31905:799-1419(+)
MGPPTTASSCGAAGAPPASGRGTNRAGVTPSSRDTSKSQGTSTPPPCMTLQKFTGRDILSPVWTCPCEKAPGTGSNFSSERGMAIRRREEAASSAVAARAIISAALWSSTSCSRRARSRAPSQRCWIADSTSTSAAPPRGTGRVAGAGPRRSVHPRRTPDSAGDGGGWDARADVRRRRRKSVGVFILCSMVVSSVASCMPYLAGTE